MYSDSDGNNCSRLLRCLPVESIVFTILSSLGSVIGGLLIIGTFLRWKDLRTVARIILVFLAIADLFTGVGYIFGAAIYLRYQHPLCLCRANETGMNHTDFDTYQDLCTAQSFLTTLFPMSSFLWTANLSIYLFISIGLQKSDFAKKLMVPFHVTAWGIPLITCIVLVGLKRLGSSSGQSNAAWCWIKNIGNNSTDGYITYYMLEFIAGKMWEIIVIIVSLALCLAIKIMLWRRYKAQTMIVSPDSTDSAVSIQLRAAFTKIDQKLVWIPVVFFLVRIWGIIRFFISAPPIALNPSNCSILYSHALVILQSIGDPGQGWSNALLFVIFNDKIYQRLCPCLYACGTRCQGACKSAKTKLKKKRMKRTHFVKKSLMNGGVVTYNNGERQSLITDSNYSVLYQSTPEDVNIKKKRLENPNADASSINKFTE